MDSLDNVTYNINGTNGNTTFTNDNINFTNFSVTFPINGANYILQFDKLYRKITDDDDDNSKKDNLLFHLFNNNNFNHTLYSLDNNLIYYNGENNSNTSYTIILTFSNNADLSSYVNKIKNNESDTNCSIVPEITEKKINCVINVTINTSNPEVLKIISLSEIDYSNNNLYEIYYNSNATCISENNANDDYYLYFISHKDLGDIHLKYNNEEIEGDKNETNDNKYNTTFKLNNSMFNSSQNFKFESNVSNINTNNFELDINIPFIPQYTIKNISLNKFRALENQKIDLTFNQETIVLDHFELFVINLP